MISSNNKSYSNQLNSNSNLLTYEDFIYDYLSTYATYKHSSNTLLIHEHQIPISNNNNLVLDKNFYINLINQKLLPFETETNQLVIFINNEIITLSIEQWLFYKEKYRHSKWINQLKHINRNIPIEFNSIIEKWLSKHTKLLFDTHELNINGFIIPLIGNLGLKILNFNYSNINYWKLIFQYLIYIGYVSYNSIEKCLYIVDHKFTIQSYELIDNILQYLYTLNNIHFEHNQLWITNDFILPYEYIDEFFIQKKNFNLYELAHLLIRICHIKQNKDEQIILLEFHQQILKIPKQSLNNSFYRLIQWLNQLCYQNLIRITKENNIIIYSKQIIRIKYEHIHAYMKMKNKNDIIIHTNDIANILLIYNYVKYSFNQLIFPIKKIILDINVLNWLQTIINSIYINENKQETEIILYDNQRIIVSYEYMLPTNDREIIANYLYENGRMNYNMKTKTYSYYYISPDQRIEYKNQHQLISNNIKHIHIDQEKKCIEIEFIDQSNYYLQLPINWYEQIYEHYFNRSYIIDMLLTNDSILDYDRFIFNNQSYKLIRFDDLKIYKQKENLINYYVEFIHNYGRIQYDHRNYLLILENLIDQSKLYLTREHTKFIEQNQYQLENMKYLLNRYSHIEQDEFENWLLYYNNQCIQIPSLNYNHNEHFQILNNELFERYYETIDYMYNHDLIHYDQQFKLFQLHFSNQILKIPIEYLQSIIDIRKFHLLNKNILPFNSYQLSQWLLMNSDHIKILKQNSIEIIYQNQLYYLELNTQDSNLKLIFPSNNSTIDPLILLANYIYRTSIIYQDEFNRLVIKLHNNEIVIPHIEALNSIHQSSEHIGMIIARLINRIGNIKLTNNNGLIITIGKNSLELSNELINKPLIRTNLKRQHLTLPLLKHSKSTSSLSSSNIKHSWFNDDQQMIYKKNDRENARYLNFECDQQRLLSHLKLRLLIILDNEINSSLLRFYIQYMSEFDINHLETQSKLINPRYYQNIALRQTPVYVHRLNNHDLYYDNLAQYLSTEQTYLSSCTIRRMLKFSSRDEYFTYLSQYMSSSQAEQLVRDSEELSNE